MLRLSSSLLLPLALLGCKPSTTVAPDSIASADLRAIRADATRGVEDPALAEILAEHWTASLRFDPLQATRLGVHAFDDRIADPSDDTRAASRRLRDQLHARLVALVGLTPGDTLTRDLLVADLAADRATDVCRYERWQTDVNDNPLARYGDLPRFHPLGTPADLENLATRYEAIARAVAVERELLRDGLAAGLVADAESLRRTIAMLDAQLTQPVDEWSLLSPLRGLEIEPGLRARLHAAVDGGIRPALAHYRDLLANELLPHGRPDGRGGISGLPLGEACYAAEILRHTTLTLSADEIHQIGLDEIARIDGEFVALGARALGTRDLASTLARLRDDPALYFASAAEVEATAASTLAEAKAAMGRFFGRLPQADCVVARVPDYKAPFTTIAYYEPANPDGSKPGEYFVNVLDPHTRPRYEARVLAIHESIPGHHLQIAIAQELTLLPAFRRNAGYSAFVEGWALYTERLGDEMGLYPTDLDRIGVLSFDAWRAARLVVDTGLHTKGWTREQAERFMLEHTALAANNIRNEVDRYLGWPGQALSYKLGQREVLALRRQAEAALGERFALPAFHDAVLGAGAVTLPVLRARVQAWIAAALREPARLSSRGFFSESIGRLASQNHGRASY